jgi:hypothetical protein
VRPSASEREVSTGDIIMSSRYCHATEESIDDSLPEGSIDQVPTDEPDHDEMRPHKRQKRIPHPHHDQYEQELRPKLQRLNRLTRWNYFIEFSTEGMHEIITAAFGEISVDSYEYSYARQKVQNWTKSWKSKSLQNMLVRYSATISLSFAPVSDRNRHMSETRRS